MARIIDIRAFVGMIKLKGCAEEYYVEITDDFIKENNGRWDIILSDKSVIKRGKVMRISIKTDYCGVWRYIIFKD